MQTANGCSCPSSRFHLDWHKRCYVPEAYRHTIGIVDTNGNLVYRFGRFGNLDDALKMKRTDPPVGRYAATWDKAIASEGVAMFQIVSGDAATRPRQLLVLPEPVVRDVRLRVQWPAYTGRKPQALSTGHLEALGGARVEVSAVANLNVVAASLVFQRNPAVIMDHQGKAMTPAAASSGCQTLASEAGSLSTHLVMIGGFTPKSAMIPWES